MLYSRRDFRPDKQPRRMSTWREVWSLMGRARYLLGSRAASKHRQDFKNEHNNRQRTHNRKVIDRELRGIDWEDDEEEP